MNLFLNKKYCEGQALMTAVFFFMVVSLIILAGLVTSTLSGAQMSRDLLSSKKSYFMAEAGSEDAVYRVTKGKNYSPEEVIVIDGFYATTTILDVADGMEIKSTADISSKIRKVKISLTNDTGVSFHYGLQVGDGGIRMEQSSMITGNLYSNGPVESISSNEIYGDAVSAGPLGSITGIYATGTIYAHNIIDSEAEGDAYYQTISGSTIWGDLYPGSPDQSFVDMPITDETIENWKSAAIAGTIITAPCPYVITTDTTIGPTKFECDLEIEQDAIVTLDGHIWVEGNIEVRNSAKIKINPLLGRRSVAIIADNPADRLTDGKITLEQSVLFYGSGTEGSYVLVISQNNSAENGGDEDAILLQNTADGDLLLYASHGKIYLNNRSDLKEVTAYKILMRNQANVIYETGLANLLFKSGPGGGFSLDAWREIE